MWQRHKRCRNNWCQKGHRPSYPRSAPNTPDTKGSPAFLLLKIKLLRIIKLFRTNEIGMVFEKKTKNDSRYTMFF